MNSLRNPPEGTSVRGGVTTDRAFVAVVAGAALLAGAAAAAGTVPAGEAPAYALHSPIVHRAEIALALFGVIYAVLVLVRLAASGLTPHRLGTTTVDLPQVAATVMDVRGGLSASDQLLQAMTTTLEDHAERIARIEHICTDTTTAAQEPRS